MKDGLVRANTPKEVTFPNFGNDIFCEFNTCELYDSYEKILVVELCYKGVSALVPTYLLKMQNCKFLELGTEGKMQSWLKTM